MLIITPPPLHTSEPISIPTRPLTSTAPAASEGVGLAAILPSSDPSSVATVLISSRNIRATSNPTGLMLNFPGQIARSFDGVFNEEKDEAGFVFKNGGF